MLNSCFGFGLPDLGRLGGLLRRPRNRANPRHGAAAAGPGAGAARSRAAAGGEVGRRRSAPPARGSPRRTRGSGWAGSVQPGGGSGSPQAAPRGRGGEQAISPQPPAPGLPRRDDPRDGGRQGGDSAHRPSCGGGGRAGRPAAPGVAGARVGGLARGCSARHAGPGGSRRGFCSCRQTCRRGGKRPGPRLLWTLGAGAAPARRGGRGGGESSPAPAPGTPRGHREPPGRAALGSGRGQSSGTRLQRPTAPADPLANMELPPSPPTPRRRLPSALPPAPPRRGGRAAEGRGRWRASAPLRGLA